MPEGFLSSHLVGGIPPGTVIRLAAPQGTFVMPDPAPAKVIFLTGGSGITPVMSMLRTMKRRNQLRDVVHVHSAPSVGEVMFAAELAELHRANPGYRLIVRATSAQGRLDPGRIGTVVTDWRERRTWACGPPGLLDDAERHWAAAGLGDRLHTERFTAPSAPGGGSGGTVTFAGTGRSVTADGATSLLEAGERAGVLPRFGCRMGICHTCVVNLLDGRVRDLRTGAEYEPGSRVQTCVTAPAGDCMVDI